MDFSQVKKWTIPQGSVKQVSANGTVIWKGTWKFTIVLGDYVSKVKWSIDNTNWTSIAANTTLEEIDSGKTLYIKAETYSDKPSTYQYTYDMTNHNFDVTRTEANDGGSVTVYRTASPVDRYYTITWKNWDGTVLETDTNVIHDATPSYDGSTPTRASTAEYNYTFSGWSPSVSTVTGNQTYTAQFNSSARYYTSTVYAGDYISTLKARASGGSWSAAGASASVSHTYNQTVEWALVNYSTGTKYYKSGYRYYYSGDTSGSFSGGQGTTKTINRSCSPENITATLYIHSHTERNYTISRYNNDEIIRMNDLIYYTRGTHPNYYYQTDEYYESSKLYTAYGSHLTDSGKLYNKTISTAGYFRIGENGSLKPLNWSLYTSASAGDPDPYNYTSSTGKLFTSTIGEYSNELGETAYGQIHTGIPKVALYASGGHIYIKVTSMGNAQKVLLREKNEWVGENFLHRTITSAGTYDSYAYVNPNNDHHCSEKYYYVVAKCRNSLWFKATFNYAGILGSGRNGSTSQCSNHTLDLGYRGYHGYDTQLQEVQYSVSFQRGRTNSFTPDYWFIQFTASNPFWILE